MKIRQFHRSRLLRPFDISTLSDLASPVCTVRVMEQKPVLSLQSCANFSQHVCLQDNVSAKATLIASRGLLLSFFNAAPSLGLSTRGDDERWLCMDGATQHPSVTDISWPKLVSRWLFLRTQESKGIAAQLCAALQRNEPSANLQSCYFSS